MKVLIIDGAEAFLDSHAAFLTFLKKYEVSEIRFVETEDLTGEIDKAVAAMEKAERIYSDLKSTADRTPYRYDVFWKLVFFDYPGFQYNKQLNRDVFSRVELYLGRGDVRGCYGYSLAVYREIIESLKTIKKGLQNGDNYVLDESWRLNHIYSETLLFGQYVAQVFYKVTGRR